MAKAFIIKDPTHDIRTEDRSDTARLEIPRVNFENGQIRKDREISIYVGETDPCSRIQKLLKAVELNQHHILNVAHFAEIKVFLQDSRLIKSNGKPGYSGGRILSLERDDARFVEECVGILSELERNNSEVSICIMEVISTFVIKNIEVVTVSKGLHQMDNKLKIFLELIGILGVTEEYRSHNWRVDGKIITEKGKEILCQLNDKINPVGKNKDTQPIKILSDWQFLNNWKFFNNWKNKFTKFTNNYHIKVNIVIVVIFFVALILLGLFLKWVVELFPASLL